MTGNDHVMYGGVDLSRWANVTYDRSIMPETSVDVIDVPGGVSRLKSVSLKPLEVTARLRLTVGSDDDLADVRHAVASVLMSTEAKALVLPDDPSRYLMAVVSGTSDLDSLFRTGMAEVKFLAPDPVAYGTHHEVTLSTRNMLRVGGNRPARATITATPGSGSWWKVTNYGTGEFVQITATFDGTQVVVVDMDAQRATLNGSDVAVTLGSDFWSMDGTADVRLSSGSGTIEWDERWL